MRILLRVLLMSILAVISLQTPVFDTTESIEELIEMATLATTQLIPIENDNALVDDLKVKLQNMKRQVAAFKSKSQADAAKVLELQDLLAAYETQIDANTSTIQKQEDTIKNLNSSVNSFKTVFMEKDLALSNLQLKSLDDEVRLQDNEVQLSDYREQLKTSQAFSCLPFGNSTAIHLLNVPGGEPFFAPCESRLKHGPGWTVIQRRLDGSVDFYRNWNEYRQGFGDLSGEFFIGLDKLHRMTSNEPHELLIYLYVASDTKSYKYDRFLIGSEEEKYKLKVLGSSSDFNNNYNNYYYNNNQIKVDGMRKYAGMKFTTYDQDNDNFWWTNCAKELHGAWWFDECKSDIVYTHLNAKYRDIHFEGLSTLKYVQMMIRPKNVLKKL